MHYLNDFLVVTAVEDYRGSHALHILLETFKQLGFPAAWDKLEGPTPCLTFLGFKLDSLCKEIHILGQKLDDIKKELEEWIGRKSC